MVRDFIDPVLRCAHWVEYYRLRWGGDVGEVQACISELRFLHLCLWWFSRYDKDDCREENWENLRSMVDAIEIRLEKLEHVSASGVQKAQFKSGLECSTWNTRAHDFMHEFNARALEKEETEEREFKMDYNDYLEEDKQEWDVYWSKAVKAVKCWSLWSTHIERTIEECKPHIRRHCATLLDCTFKYRSAPSAYQMLRFLDAILQRLTTILGCCADEAVPLKKQIESFQGKLPLLVAFFKLIPNCILVLRDFKIGLYDDINNDINKLAWLAFFFWAKAGDQDIAAELNHLMSDMSRKITKPSMYDFTSLFFGVLKVMQPDDALLLGQAVPGILDFLFKYLDGPFQDDYHIFRDGMIMYFTFLANPPEEYVEDEELFFILGQLGDVLRQGSPLAPPIDDTIKDSSEKKVYLNDFVTMIERLKGKIRRMHNIIPDSSSCDFPRTNGLGFIDFLLQNLKEKLNGDMMFIPFGKNLIIKIEQELVFLRPNLNDIFELQKEHKELQETWLQLINLAYVTEHTINSCSVILYPIWYNMVRLADILDEFKVVKGKLDTVKQSNSHKAAILLASVGYRAHLPEIPTQAWYSGANEVMVGCQEEVDTIVDQLTRGPKSLEIVSIVGMGGSGKSTLARKVYDGQQVRSHFHIFAFCTVSQVYSTRNLLLQILKDIKLAINDINSKTDDDLAHLLHRKLSCKRYLVVMDDIWKIEAWEKVKSSFPNENEGSRVIFTTREHEVAVKAQRKFSPHSKTLLSDTESLELLQKMAFPKADCPPNLCDVAQMIARKCGGLPLAIAVIGRLLAQKERSLTLWNEIAEKTSSFAAEEGCMKVLELSYIHLPEHLKSCFLYLGVFAEDELIPAKRLILLWIAEGFVQKSERDRVESVAEEYLNELVDRSLVQVAKRSSDNRIKTCQLHDVIGDFCQRKAQEENIFHMINGTVGNSSHSNRYRLSIDIDWEHFVDLGLSDPGIKSLLYSSSKKYSYGCRFMFSKFPLVEVLYLENVFFGKGEVDRALEIITSLVHLRYLRISIMRIKGILSRISNLENLETFILFRDSSCLPLGQTFWRMERLRHLDVGLCNLIPCKSMFEAYPPLYNLECFSTLVLNPRTSTRILQRLPNLRKLSCKFYPVSDSILALDVLSKLESVKLELGDRASVIFPVTLKKLSLEGYSIPSRLGELPRLEVLKIDGYRVERWDIEYGQFPMLKFLKLKNSCMREWNVSDGSFPRLEQLVFDNCNNLHDMPASFQESTTLKNIVVFHCSSRLASSASEIRDEQNDLGNEIELIISGTWHFQRGQL